MTDHPILSRRKWMLHSGGQHIVVVKGVSERFSHPLMKALLWALYLPQYPNMSIEIRIGDRYKPDVIAFPPENDLREGTPVFWGEAGQVGGQKVHKLVRRYRNTHFAIAKWSTPLEPHRRWVSDALKGVSRTAPFDLIRFHEGSAEQFIDEDGHVQLTHDDIEWIRL